MSDRPCFVYFVQAGVGGPIKIGISTNVRARMVKMQTDAAAPLRLLAIVPGDQQQEARYHRLVSSHKQSGEWFAPHADVFALIEAERARLGNIEILAPAKQKIPASRFQAWRIAQGMTAKESAALFQLDIATISQLENQRRYPSFVVMERIYRLSNGAVEPNDFAPWLERVGATRVAQ